MAAQGVLTALRAVSVVAVVGEGVETVAGGGEDGGAAADEAPAGAHHGGGDDVGHGERAGGAAVLLHGVLVVLVVVDELHILVRRRRPPHRRHHEWSERMGKRVCSGLVGGNWQREGLSYNGGNYELIIISTQIICRKVP